MRLSAYGRASMEFCRVMTSLCIMADGGWYLWSYDVRAAYMKELGIPTQFVYVAAIVYLYFGFRLLLNYSPKNTGTGMIIAYGIVAFIIHHPVGDGGIGEYPRNINREVNLLSILKYSAAVGGLFQLGGYEDFKRRGMIMQGTHSYAIVLGRSIIGIHYMLESGWFRLYQHNLRTTQVNLLGGDPILHVWVVGAFYFMGGLNIFMGDVTRRRIASLLLTTMTTILTAMEGSKIATSNGIFHMTSKARFHHVIMNIQIILGCIMIFTMAEHEPAQYARKKD